MARKLYSRLLIDGTLTAVTPLHVGGFGDNPDTDMPLAINGSGQFYIPGTSVAGVLRAWCRKRFGDAETNNLFGPEQTNGNNGFASFVTIDDLVFNENVQCEIRDSVGIDRIYGTAADHAKFDRAIIPKGSTLNLSLIVDFEKKKNETEDENNKRIAKTKAIIGWLLDDLQKQKVRFGASRTRGLGKLTLGDVVTIKSQELNNPAGILTLLQGTGTHLSIQNLKDADKTLIPFEEECLVIDIGWKPKSSLMVKAAYDGIGVDSLPLTSGVSNGYVSLVIPGGSIKGAFRSQAERIVRTLLNIIDTNTKKDFHEQIKLDLVNELFGAKKEKDKNRSSHTAHLGLGALSKDDCYADKKIPLKDWQDVESAKAEEKTTYTDQGIWKSLKKVEDPGKANDTVFLSEVNKEFLISHHVAIDRWTGGASNGALFTVLQPAPDFGWEHICLILDLSRIPNDKKLCAVMLLLLVLRDFAANRVPIGFASNRGMGEVHDVNYTVDVNKKFVKKLVGIPDDQELSFDAPGLKSILKKEWETWIQNNQKSGN